eukprot:jgi/Astpho2/2874/fgenesh1_pg.00050_%23_130_t
MKADAGPTAASLAATVAFLPEGKPAGALQQMVQQVLREAHILAKLELPPAAHRVSFVQLRPPGAGLLPVIFAPHDASPDGDALQAFEWPSNPPGLLVRRGHHRRHRTGHRPAPGVVWRPRNAQQGQALRLLRRRGCAVSARDCFMAKMQSPDPVAAVVAVVVPAARMLMEDLADAVADWNRNVGGDRVTLQPWLEVLPEILKPSLPMLLWHFLHGQDAICRCSGMQHDLPLPQHRLHFAGGTRQHGKRDVQESLMPIAAAVRIQACWRAVRVRRRIQPCTRLLLRRAAIAIQRCWRAYMLRERLRMLHAVHVQALMIAGMQPGDRLCLPVTDLQLLLHRQNLGEKLRKLQQLPAAEADAARAEARRHLWTTFPEHHTHFAFEEGPGSLFVVGQGGVERAGLPRWTGCLIYSTDQGLAEHAQACLKGLLGFTGLTADPPAGAAAPVVQREHIRALGVDTTCQAGDAVELLTEGTLMERIAVPSLQRSVNEDERVLVAVSLQGKHGQGELQRRAGLLLALSWDPLKRKGITLWPRHPSYFAGSVKPAAAQAFPKRQAVLPRPSTTPSTADALSMSYISDASPRSGTSGFPCNLEGLAEHTASGAATPIQGPSPSPTQAGLKGHASGLGGGAAFEGNGPQVTCTSRLGGAFPVDPKEEHARLVQELAELSRAESQLYGQVAAHLQEQHLQQKQDAVAASKAWLRGFSVHRSAATGHNFAPTAKLLTVAEAISTTHHVLAKVRKARKAALEASRKLQTSRTDRHATSMRLEGRQRMGRRRLAAGCQDAARHRQAAVLKESEAQRTSQRHQLQGGQLAFHQGVNLLRKQIRVTEMQHRQGPPPESSHHCRNQLLRAAAADTVMQQRCEERNRQANIERLHDKTATNRTLAAELAAAGMTADVRAEMAEARAALQEVVAARRQAREALMFMVGPAGGWRGCNQPIEYRRVLPLNIIGSAADAAGLAEESSSDSLDSADDGCNLHPSAPPPTCIRGPRPQPNQAVTVSEVVAAVQPDAAAQPQPAGGAYSDAPPSLAVYAALKAV